LPIDLITKSLKNLIGKNLILKAGIEVPTYVHHEYTDIWLVKLPSWSCASIEMAIKNESNALHYV